MRRLLILVIAAVGGALFFGSVRELVVLSLNKSIYSHTLMIPFVSLYIFWINRRAIFSTLRFAPWPGAALMGVGIVLLLVARGQAEALSQNDRLFFSTSGMVAWLIGGFVWICGVQAMRRALFPLLYLLFIIPVPSVVMGPVVTMLQTGSAYAARGVLKLIGVPVYFEGMMIALPGVTVEVAEQCSGIRSAMALMMLSVVAAYMYLDTNGRRLLFVLAVIPVTIFKNGLRVVTLAMLGAYVDMSYLTDSVVHSSGGKPFFIVAVALMLPVLLLLRRGERKEMAVGQAAFGT